MRIDESIQHYNEHNRVQISRAELAKNKKIFPKSDEKTNLVTLSYWASGRQKPKLSPDQFSALCDFLDVSADYMLLRSANPRKCDK